MMPQPKVWPLMPRSSGRWLVHLRDEKSGRIMPVVIPDSDAKHKAITDAMNRAARFVPGCDWRPVSGRRIE